MYPSAPTALLFKSARHLPLARFLSELECFSLSAEIDISMFALRLNETRNDARCAGTRISFVTIHGHILNERRNNGKSETSLRDIDFAIQDLSHDAAVFMNKGKADLS